jgi:hypothetical protein
LLLIKRPRNSVTTDFGMRIITGQDASQEEVEKGSLKKKRELKCGYSN